MTTRKTLFVLLLALVPALNVSAGESDELDEARRALDEAARTLAELYKSQVHTTEKKPMLGILLNDSGDEDGIVLAGVTPGSGAAKEGLKAGDRVVSIAGQSLVNGEVKPLKAISTYMKTVSAGDSVDIEYIRDDERVAASVVVSEANRHRMAKILEETDFSALADLGGLAMIGSGMVGVTPQFVDMEEDLGAYFGVDEGVLVIQSSGDLKGGDVLLEVDGKAVSTAKDAYTMLGAASGEVSVQVRRNDEARQVSADGDAFSKFDPSAVSSKIRVIRTGDHDHDAEHKVEIEVIVDDD